MNFSQIFPISTILSAISAPFKVVILSFVCTLAIGCLPGNETTDDIKVKPYFPLEEFIEAEAIRLQEQALQLHKTVVLNHETETKDFDNVTWINELAAFTSADINKSALINKYNADTTLLGEGKFIWKYVAKDSSLRTQQLNVYGQNNQLEKVEILIATKNMLYSSSQTLQYKVDVGYNISGWQKIRFFEKDEFSTKAEFIQ